MIIRVKEKESGEEKEKEEKERTSERGRNEEESRKALRNSLLDHDSSVEVGYGLCYFIVNSK